MAVNKVQLANGTTLIDLTQTTATAPDVAAGKYFYTASGVKTPGTGTFSGITTQDAGSGVNIVKLADGTTLIDVSDATATAGDVLEGKYFLTSKGILTEGLATSGPAGLSYYETAGSGKQYFEISTPFTPAAIFAWDTYRWNNSNFGSNQVCIYALWDSTHGSICAKPYSTTAVTPSLNNASYSNGQFNNGKSSNFMASRTYVIVVLSADALANGIADYVYVEEWTGDGGTSHATSCPFTPDFWIFYNTTSMDNGANTNQTAIFRMTDNLNLGYYLGNTASGTSISSGAAAISAVNTGATVSTSRKFTSGQSYKFIAVKKP